MNFSEREQGRDKQKNAVKAMMSTPAKKESTAKIRVTFAVDGKLWDNFRDAAKHHRVSMSEVLGECIEKYMKDNPVE